MDGKQRKRRLLLEKLKPEELPVSAKQIADAIGLESVLLLCEQLGGVTLYIPKADSLFQQTRVRVISEEYTGYNAQQLAAKYDVSDSWVRRIVAKDSSV